MSSTASHVVVIGGGIAGLAAAHGLLTQASESGRPLDVTVLEADASVGGKIRTTPFAGLPAVDEGADAFLARVPWATDLARAVGLEDHLVSPAIGKAAVWWNGLQPIPEGLLLGLPTDLGRLARTPLLSWRGKARAATEPFRRRTPIDSGPGADSIGAYVRARFGDEVHERLVDPLVGSIYAADTDRFSLAAVPQLAELAGRGRSVLLAARHRPPAPTGPVFYAPDRGVGALVDAVAADVIRLGGNITTGAPVAALRRDQSNWRVDDLAADAVVLACPAAATALLLPAEADRHGHAHPSRGTDPLVGVRQALTTITTADVVLITLAIPASSWPERLHGLSGYLVPKPMQRLVTAVSFASQKWAHLQPDGSVLLRISLGRDGLPVMHLDDDALLRAAIDEVGDHLGFALTPTETRITRWYAAFPQYRPGHHLLVAETERNLPAGLTLAGASYHGIGIPACIRSGQQAAAATLSGLAGREE